MANRMIEKVKVQELTKWGYKDNEGYVNFSKTLSENDRAAVVPGAMFEAEIYVSDPTEKYPEGTRYLNKIVARTAKVEVPKLDAVTESVVDVARAKKFTPKFEKKVSPDNSMSKAEWQAKDRSQLIGGLSHDAAALAVAVLNLAGSNEPGTESALRVYKTLLEGMLKIREEVK